MSLNPQPLLDAARAGRPWHQATDCPGCDSVHRDRALCVSDRDLADLLGVERSTIRAWRVGRNQIADNTADHYAATLHMHPWEIWPELAANDPNVKTCEQCGVLFVPGRPWGRFCTRRCQQASPGAIAARARWAREQYQIDENYRERRKAQRRDRYWSSSRRAELVKQRERDRAKRTAA